MPNTQPRGKQALQGRVVCMDDGFRILDEGVVFIQDDRIATVQASTASVPAEFIGIPVEKTGGTIFPGLIDLHNHLSYDILTLWQVPQQYVNRDDWPKHPDYRRLISGPMQVLGKHPKCLPALARYVEAKCLLGGTTASQGPRLSNAAGVVRYYRGLVRNVEYSSAPGLPSAQSRIPDVAAAHAEAFLAEMKHYPCLLLHLSEGTDERARKHFQDLHLADGSPAFTDALAGIHCVALQSSDFQRMATTGNGASMVWSPFSNLLLYGRTADIKAAKDSGITIGLGCDWTPSGSRNLLGELKVASLASSEAGGVFSSPELVALVTRNAARILRWDRMLGSIEEGKYADLIVVKGRGGDPYDQLIQASEKELSLVMIGGTKRVGVSTLMQGIAASEQEAWTVGGEARVLDLADSDADPLVQGLTLAAAKSALEDGLKNLKQFAKDLETGPSPHLMALSAAARPTWSLYLDHEEPDAYSMRPLVGEPAYGCCAPTKASALMAAHAVAPLSQILGPLSLDQLTVADDVSYVARIKTQPNLPVAIRDGLVKMLGG